MRLILVRHGETQLNKEGRFQGIDDTPLNATGRTQSHALSRALAADMPFVMYSSTVPRALETARIVSEDLHVPFLPVQGLEELDIGELSGLDGEEMRWSCPGFLESWRKDPSAVKLPGGESIVELRDRVWHAIVMLGEKHSDDTVVAVSHNFAILTVVFKALNMPLSQFRRLQHDLCAITRLEISQDQCRLVSFNETLHLNSLVSEENDNP